MRFLTLKEADMITGVGFSEDINTAASVLFVGFSIGALSAGIGAGIIGLVGAITSALTPFSVVGNIPGACAIAGGSYFVAGPLIVGNALLLAHPEYKTALNDKFHFYFG